MRRAWISAVVVLSVVLVAVGCGGGSGGSKAGGTTVPPSPNTVSTAPATTTTTVDVAALTATATAAMWTTADFPTAFKPQIDGMGTCPETADTCASLNLEDVWHDLTTCLGVTDTPQAKVVSPTYLEGIATQARVTVEYTSPDAAAAVGAALAGPKFKACMTPTFDADAKRSAPTGATPGPSTVSALTAPSESGLAATTSVSSNRVNVTMTLGTGSSALQIFIYQDFLVYIHGDTIVRFFFLNPGSAFVVPLEQALVMDVLSKVDS